MSQEVLSTVKIIEAMSREDFRLKFVKGICQTKSFGALASFKAENISPEEKQEVRSALTKIGIPATLAESDDDLNRLAAAVSARAVALR